MVFIFGLAVLLIAGGLIGYIFYTYWHGQAQYEDLYEHVTVADTDDSDMITLSDFKVDWDALRAINPDVVGWVYCPNTIINYPIVWREDDEAYYMKHNFNGDSVGDFGAEYGCPVLSEANSPKWVDQTNFIAGHHLLDGSMFSLLQEFIDEDTFNSHRTFYVLTPEGNFRTTSFACDMVSGKAMDIVQPNFETKEGFQAYLQERLDDTEVEAIPPGKPISDIKQIMVFYTCNEPDNRYRILVCCSVDEFLPAGSNKPLGNSLISEEDVAAVKEQYDARTA